MNRYDEIIALRRELKRPGALHHNKIQLRMVMWHFTIRCSAFFKRLMDIIISIVAIIVGSPIFLITALLIKLTSPGPIIFSQVRVVQTVIFCYAGHGNYAVGNVGCSLEKYSRIPDTVCV